MACKVVNFCRNLLAAAISVSALMIASYAHAATYYVDFKNGDDSASGVSTSSPWKRSPGDPLAAGVAKSTKLIAGDKVVLKGGVTYHGYISTNKFSGTNGKSIKYVGNEWGDRRAIISGSNPVDSVTPCTSQEACSNNPNWQKLSIIRFNTANPEIRLFTTEGMLYESQFPKMPNVFYSDNVTKYMTLPAEQTVDFEKGILKSPDLAARLGGKAEDIKINYWASPNVIARQNITAINGDVISFTPKVDAQGVRQPLQRGRATLSFLNSPTLIDGPNQYASLADKKTAIAWLPIPGTKVFVGANRRAGIGFIGSGSDIVVTGFIFQHFDASALVTSGSFSNIVVTNNIITESAINGNGRIASLNNINNLVFTGNTVSNIQKGGGVALSNITNGVLSRNTIKRIHYSGMLLMNNSNLIVNNNSLSDINGTHGNGVAIYLDNRNVRFENNTITDSVRPVTFHGKDPSVVNNLTIAYNFLESTTNYPISSWGSTQNVSIFGNVLLGNKFGILVNNSDVNLKITNNFISSDRGIAINKGAGVGADIQYNLLSPMNSPETQAINGLLTNPNKITLTVNTILPLPAAACNAVVPAKRIGVDFGCPTNNLLLY